MVVIALGLLGWAASQSATACMARSWMKVLNLQSASARRMRPTRRTSSPSKKSSMRMPPSGGGVCPVTSLGISDPASSLLVPSISPLVGGVRVEHGDDGGEAVFVRCFEDSRQYTGLHASSGHPQPEGFARPWQRFSGRTFFVLPFDERIITEDCGEVFGHDAALPHPVFGMRADDEIFREGRLTGMIRLHLRSVLPPRGLAIR